MPLTIASAISLLSVTLVCIATPNCGSSSGGSGGKPYAVAGNWQSAVSTGSGSVLYIGAVDAQGKSLLFATSDPAFIGDTWELPTITGASSFSGNSSIYAAPGTQLPSGGTAQTLSSQGKVISANSITLTDSNGSFTVMRGTPLAGAVTALSGTMTGVVNDGMAGGPIFGLDFTATSGGSSQSMSFTVSGNSTCSVAGTFTQVGTSNVFDVAITFSGACPFPTGTPLSGLGFESSTDYFNDNAGQPGTYLYADVLSSGNSAFVIEIY